MKNKLFKILMYVAAILMLLAFLFSFDFIAEPVAKAVGKPVQAIKDIAKTVLFCSIGVFLIVSGAATIAVPVIAVSLIVVGLGLLYFGLAPLFNKEKTFPEVISNK